MNGVREVEVKYRVPDVDATAAALTAAGWALGTPTVQDDQAYAPAGWSYGAPKIGVSFVRLRTVAGRHTFTLKQPAENALSCVEHETVVADRAAMHAAILAMGYRPTVRIVKSRRTATDGVTTLCLDVVDGLGGFVELERMISGGVDGRIVQAELDAMVAGLGVEAYRTDETYDSLVRAATRV